MIKDQNKTTKRIKCANIWGKKIVPSKEDRKGKSAEAGAHLTCHTHPGVVAAEQLAEVAPGMLGAGIILQ